MLEMLLLSQGGDTNLGMDRDKVSIYGWIWHRCRYAQPTLHTCKVMDPWDARLEKRGELGLVEDFGKRGAQVDQCFLSPHSLSFSLSLSLCLASKVHVAFHHYSTLYFALNRGSSQGEACQ